VAKFLKMYEEYKNYKDVTKTRLYLEAMEEILPGITVYIEDNSSGVQKLVPLKPFDSEGANRMIKKAVLVCTLIFALIILFSGMFIVTEGEYVCIRRFGKIIDTKDSAGLYFKMPFIDSKLTLPIKNTLQPSGVKRIDKGQKDMVIDNYVIWQISDPVEFVKSIGYISEAERRIDAAVYNTVKNTMGTLEQNSIINEKLSGRGKFDKIVTDEVARQLSGYGITVYDVKIKKLDLPVENEETVYERMISEREKIAEQYKAEGEYEANKIKNEVDKQVNIIISEAKASARS